MRWWLVAAITLLAGKIFATDIWEFEPNDTIEEIQAKIEHNGYAFQVRTNYVFDLPAEERQRFHSRYHGVYKPSLKSSIGPLQTHLNRELPSSFDWRNYNGHTYIGPIKDQGNCGSCYAFGACAAAEGTYNVANNRYDGACVSFSESYIMWCLGSLPQYYYSFYGCDGADYSYSELTALTSSGGPYAGLPSAAAYPYTIIQPPSCQHFNDPRTVFEAWYRIPCNDINAIKTAILTYGPIDVAVYAGSAFDAYWTGIYEDSLTTCNANPCSYASANHAVALVGWNDAGGYWILRNSWGTGWGENGYMRIRYGSAHVNCAGAYLVYRAPTPTPTPTPRPTPIPTITPGPSEDFITTFLPAFLKKRQL